MASPLLTVDEIKAWMEGKPISSCTPKIVSKEAMYVKLLKPYSCYGFQEGEVCKVIKVQDRDYILENKNGDQYWISKSSCEEVDEPKKVCCTTKAKTLKTYIKLVDVVEYKGYKKGAIHEVTRETEHSYYFKTGGIEYGVDKKRVDVAISDKSLAEITPKAETPKRGRGRPKTLYVKYIGTEKLLELKWGDIVRVIFQSSTIIYVKSNTNSLSYSVLKENCVFVPKPVPVKICKKRGRKPSKWVQMVSIMEYPDMKNGDIVKVVEKLGEEPYGYYRVISAKGIKHSISCTLAKEVSKPEPIKKEYKYKVTYTKSFIVCGKNRGEAEKEANKSLLYATDIVSIKKVV